MVGRGVQCPLHILFRLGNLSFSNMSHLQVIVQALSVHYTLYENMKRMKICYLKLIFTCYKCITGFCHNVYPSYGYPYILDYFQKHLKVISYNKKKSWEEIFLLPLLSSLSERFSNQNPLFAHYEHYEHIDLPCAP